MWGKLISKCGAIKGNLLERTGSKLNSSCFVSKENIEIDQQNVQKPITKLKEHRENNLTKKGLKRKDW